MHRMAERMDCSLGARPSWPRGGRDARAPRAIIMPRTLWALVLCGASLAAGADELPAERRQALLNLLRQDCGSCHGMTLKGGLGPALLPENLAGQTDELLRETILQGRPGTAMPPWNEFLAPAEADWLVRQLREKTW